MNMGCARLVAVTLQSTVWSGIKNNHHGCHVLCLEASVELADSIKISIIQFVSQLFFPRAKICLNCWHCAVTLGGYCNRHNLQPTWISCKSTPQRRQKNKKKMFFILIWAQLHSTWHVCDKWMQQVIWEWCRISWLSHHPAINSLTTSVKQPVVGMVNLSTISTKICNDQKIQIFILIASVFLYQLTILLPKGGFTLVWEAGYKL